MKTMKKATVEWLVIFLGILAAISSANAQDYSFKIEKFGNGQPVLLIPGLSSDGSVWKETVDILSKKYECHVVTLPGFAGVKPLKQDSVYLPVIVEQLVSYINSLAVKPILIGHSLGGYLILKMSSVHPEISSKNLIVDGLPFLGAVQNPYATEETIKPMAQQMKAGILNATPEQKIASQKMIMASMITDTSRQKQALKWSLSSDPTSVANAMYELYTTDLRDEIANILVPTLVLGSWKGYESYGITKEMVKRNFESQYQKLKGVKIKLSENGKHFIMWDDPEFFIEEVMTFLDNEK